MVEFQTTRQKKIAEAHKKMMEICAANEIDPRTLVSKSKRREHFEARVFVANKLNEDSYSVSVIGRVLGKRDHTTVRYYLMSDKEREARKATGRGRGK